MDPGSLYLLKEAGALLAGGAIAGALTGGGSPPYMPTLPWHTNYRNTPGPIPTPPIMTRIPAGTPAPPSAYAGEAGMLNSETGWSEAGSPAPSGSGISQAQWDALPASTQQAVLNELASRSRSAAPPVTMTTSNQAPGASPCPPGYVNIGGGEFPNNCVPAQRTTMTMAPPPAAPTPAPPIMRTFTSAPPNVAPPPAQLLPPSGGGGGGGGSTPWGPLLVGGGVVLAFLYAGRRKKGRRH